MFADLVHHAIVVLAAPPVPAPPPGAPDFSHIAPSSDGVPKSGVMYTIADVTLFFGLGICFVVGLWELITWGVGHKAGGMHISQNAKASLVRVLFVGIALTVAGGIWTWITSLS
jgi:hypothetical protein